MVTRRAIPMMPAPNWSPSITTVAGPAGGAVCVTVTVTIGEGDGVAVPVGVAVSVGVGVGVGVTVKASDSGGEITARFSGEEAAVTEYKEHHADLTTSREPKRSRTVPQCRQWKPVIRMPLLFT
jgi:hypothetical protein